MAQPGMKLSLIHKQLMLVSVPLAFGFIFVLIYQAFLQDVRHQRSQSVYGMKVSLAAHKLSQDLLDEYTRVKGEAQQPTDTAQPFDQIEKQTKADLVQLIDLVANFELHQDLIRGEQGRTLDDIEHAITRTRRTHEMLVACHRSLQGNLTFNHYVHDMEQKVFASLKELNALGENSLQAGWLDSDAFKRFDQKMLRTLAALFALNALICPLIVLYFSQHFVNRLSVIITNSERFSKGQELLPAIGGADEIAKLDSVFREMAQGLRASEQAKRDFVTMISHDLRTPLNSVQATLTVIAEGIHGKLTNEGLNKVRNAEKSAGDLISMVSELLEIDRLESGRAQMQMRPNDLQILAKRAIDSVSGFADYKNISIKADLKESFVCADEDRLTQVIINLLSNAVKFAPDGSQVDVSIADGVDQTVELRVTDRGRGIPQDMQQAIFERFNQVDRYDWSQRNGSGLGLAICKSIIAEHNGAIGVRCDDDQPGSTFWFRLRMCEKPAVVTSPLQEA
jgi:signal transduction histidine kinase